MGIFWISQVIFCFNVWQSPLRTLLKYFKQGIIVAHCSFYSVWRSIVGTLRRHFFWWEKSKGRTRGTERTLIDYMPVMYQAQCPAVSYTLSNLMSLIMSGTLWRSHCRPILQIRELRLGLSNLPKGPELMKVGISSGNQVFCLLPHPWHQLMTLIYGGSASCVLPRWH